MFGHTLAGKTAVITGAAGGIGSAIALRFALEGASVVLLGRSGEKLRAAVQTVQDGLLPRGTKPAVQVKYMENHDVRRPADWKTLTSKHVGRNQSSKRWPRPSSNDLINHVSFFFLTLINSPR